MVDGSARAHRDCKNFGRTLPVCGEVEGACLEASDPGGMEEG